MNKDLRDQFREETKKEPIRLAHQTIPSVTTDYVKWLEEQLSIHVVMCSMTESTIVRENLMTVRGYSPYCGNRKCSSGWPRTSFNKDKKQFTCSCGWVSSFPDDFIEKYLNNLPNTK